MKILLKNSSLNCSMVLMLIPLWWCCCCLKGSEIFIIKTFFEWHTLINKSKRFVLACSPQQAAVFLNKTCRFQELLTSVEENCFLFILKQPCHGVGNDKYSWLSRSDTTRGSCISLVTVGPTKA